MGGLNRFCYDKVVRNATIVPSYSLDYTPGYPASDINNIWSDYNYRSKSGVNSGWGWWYIGATFQTIYFNDGSARTAYVTVASYDADTLATEIGTQMTAVGGQTYTCTYSGTAKKFTISASSNFTLNCTTTSNAIWDHIGFDTASDKSGTNAYNSDNIRIHNRVAVTFDCKDGAAISSTVCALVGLNVTSSYQIFSLQRWTGSAWVYVADFDYDAATGRAIVSYAMVNPTEYRVFIQDWENADGYIDIGSALIGDYKELNTRFKYGFSEDIEDVTMHKFSKQGFINVITGYFVESKGVTYEVLAADETKLVDLYRDIGKRYPFVFVQDADDEINSMSYNIMVAKMSRRGQDAYTKEITFAWIGLQ